MKISEADIEDVKEIIEQTETDDFAKMKRELEILDKIDKERAKSEKQVLYSRWTQFNLDRTANLMELALKHPKAHAILYFLVDQMDQHNAVMCSQTVIREMLGISKPTVCRSVRTLEAMGFIAILKSGTSNVYAINDSVYWKSWGGNVKYSKFPANVILSETENTKFFDGLERIKSVVKSPEPGKAASPRSQELGQGASPPDSTTRV